MMCIALSLVLAYLLGSIPFAYLIGHLSGIDIRNIGDRNVGAFNVFRHAGLIAGTATLVADIGKGALAIVIARALCEEELVVFIAGSIAVVGHSWPIFLHFRGGRGVSTTIGVLLVFLPREISTTLGLSIAVLLITRNSIWCIFMLFAPLPFLCWLFDEPLSLLAYSIALPCISGLSHWLTIRFLPSEAREETKIFWISPKTDHDHKTTGQT